MKFSIVIYFEDKKGLKDHLNLSADETDIESLIRQSLALTRSNISRFKMTVVML